MDERLNAIEQMIASVTPKISVAGGGVAAVSGAVKQSIVDHSSIMTIADYGVVVGIFVGVSSLILQIIVFYRRDRRESRIEEMERKLLRSKRELVDRKHRP